MFPDENYVKAERAEELRDRIPFHNPVLWILLLQAAVVGLLAGGFIWR